MRTLDKLCVATMVIAVGLSSIGFVIKKSFLRYTGIGLGTASVITYSLNNTYGKTKQDFSRRKNYKNMEE